MPSLNDNLGYVAVDRIEATDIALGGSEVNQPNKALRELASRDAFLLGLISPDATAQATFEEFKQIGISSVAQGRLTTESGVPVSGSDRVSQTTIYYTPHTGDYVALYDTILSRWDLRQFTEIERFLGGNPAGANLDIFAFWTGSAVNLEMLGWANDTTRAIALQQLNGIWVKSTDKRRYLGTIRTSDSGRTEDSERRRLIFNAQNRVARPIKLLTSGSPYSYLTSAWRIAQNDMNNRIELMIGLRETVTVGASLFSSTSGTSGAGSVGIGVNRTNDTDAILYGNRPRVDDAVPLLASLSTALEPRFNYLALLEYGGGTVTNSFEVGPGASSGQGSSGLQGVIDL